MSSISPAKSRAAFRNLIELLMSQSLFIYGIKDFIVMQKDSGLLTHLNWTSGQGTFHSANTKG